MKGGLILTIFGVLCLLLSGAFFIFSLLLPVITNNKVDFGEAIGFILGGGCCSSLSFLFVIGGVIWMIVGRAKPGPPR